MSFLKKEFEKTSLLLRNVPSLIMVLFVLSCVGMNLLANKELFNTTYLALDCGFLLSWAAFLCGDMLTKHFGAKASIRLSIVAMICNLLVCGVFWFATSISTGNWGAFYDTGNPIVNAALDTTIGGTWYVVLGSAFAFLVSSIINALLNEGIGKAIKDNGSFKHYAVRSYVSTFIGQFADNLAFACVVSKIFFGWTWTQVLLCSLTGAVFELFWEIVLGPLSYKMVQKWKEHDVGAEYLKSEEVANA